MMPDDRDQQLRVIQRMLDAGESEENITTVIRHFKGQGVVGSPEPVPIQRPHQLRVPSDAKISQSAPFSGSPRGPLDDFIPAPNGMALQQEVAAGAPMAERLAGGVGRLMTHVADEYVPSWIKPIKGAMKDVGGRLERLPVNREEMRVGQGVNAEIAAMNARQAAQPKSVLSEPPAHATGGSGAHATIAPQSGPSRILKPGPESDWLFRDASGGGAVNPKDQQDLIRQYLMNFMRSGQ